MSTCTSTDFHTAHLTWLGRIAYSPLRLYRVIPHRLVTRRCDAWAKGER